MFTILSSFAMSVPSFAQGDGDYVPLTENLPAELNTTDATSFLIGLFTILVGVVTVLAVVWIVLGGIQYMSTDAYSGKSAGKDKIKNALLGLLLAGASWIILYTINPDILNINLNFGSDDMTIRQNHIASQHSLNTL